MAGPASMSEMPWTIRPFEGLDEYRACTALQDETWGAGFSERVPVAILKAANRIGGVAAGAFGPDGALIGFVFGISGVEEGRPVHWSDMLAVRPEARNRGLGFALKAYQRDALLSLGIERVYWTFDPLQAKNTFFNVERLGAVGVEYVVEMYGDTGSPLHEGIGSDRVIAAWDLASERVVARMDSGDAGAGGNEPSPPPIIKCERSDSGPAPVEDADLGPLERGDSRVALPIPADIDRMIHAAPEIAKRWREVTRPLFAEALGAGYRLAEVRRGDPVSTYILVRP